MEQALTQLDVEILFDDFTHYSERKTVKYDFDGLDQNTV